ncbi:thaumatin [Phascolomyces articulosus]|uniref:Thaumatin n=1 Tax=Phascolomyces articulosus TaxID=60185 RepID=A0AAD5JVI2_9FUNG|nr:thaumatin [Phascolomyces articulosus]
MLNIIKTLSVLAFAGACLAAPTSGDVTVTVKNSCSTDLHLYKLTNNGGDKSTQDVSAGSSVDFKVANNWAGRIWGCRDGEADCEKYGSAVSLAEFLFKGFEGSDFYDISFVDGFNLPMSIKPEAKSGSGYNCGVPTCASLPSCPKELQGDKGACKSACAAFGTDEYCCTGAFNDPKKCKASQYADKFKAGCPDAYSFAYDDARSTFACDATPKYTVTFCP